MTILGTIFCKFPISTVNTFMDMASEGAAARNAFSEEGSLEEYRTWAYDATMEQFLKVEKPKNAERDATVAFCGNLSVFEKALSVDDDLGNPEPWQRRLRAKLDLFLPGQCPPARLKLAISYTRPEHVKNDKQMKVLVTIEPHRAMV